MILYSLPNIIRAIESRGEGGAYHVRWRGEEPAGFDGEP